MLHIIEITKTFRNSFSWLVI